VSGAVRGEIGLAAAGYADRRHEPGTSQVRSRSKPGWGIPSAQVSWAADGVDGLAEVAGQEIGGDDLPYGPGLGRAVATGDLDRFLIDLPVAL
jgi:hypothetical protein